MVGGVGVAVEGVDGRVEGVRPANVVVVRAGSVVVGSGSGSVFAGPFAGKVIGDFLPPIETGDSVVAAVVDGELALASPLRVMANAAPPIKSAPTVIPIITGTRRPAFWVAGTSTGGWAAVGAGPRGMLGGIAAMGRVGSIGSNTVRAPAGVCIAVAVVSDDGSITVAAPAGRTGSVSVVAERMAVAPNATALRGSPRWLIGTAGMAA